MNTGGYLNLHAAQLTDDISPGNTGFEAPCSSKVTPLPYTSSIRILAPLKSLICVCVEYVLFRSAYVLPSPRLLWVHAPLSNFPHTQSNYFRPQNCGNCAVYMYVCSVVCVEFYYSEVSALPRPDLGLGKGGQCVVLDLSLQSMSRNRNDSPCRGYYGGSQIKLASVQIDLSIHPHQSDPSIAIPAPADLYPHKRSDSLALPAKMNISF